MMTHRWSLSEKILGRIFPLPMPSGPPLHYRAYRAIDSRARNWLERCLRPADSAPDMPPTAIRKAERERYHRLNTAACQYFATPARSWLLDIAHETRSTGAGLTDYYLLHRYVKARRPRRILELGSGMTTVILAHAIHELHEQGAASVGHVHSMEDIPQWHAHAKEICPSNLARHVTYLLSEKEDFIWGGCVWVFCYRHLPEGEFDFVFVDGPTAKRGNLVGVNGDLLRLLARGTTRSMDAVIDFRLTTCTSLARFLPAGRVMFDDALGLGVVRDVGSADLLPAPSMPRRLPRIDALERLGLAVPEQ